MDDVLWYWHIYGYYKGKKKVSIDVQWKFLSFEARLSIIFAYIRRDYINKDYINHVETNFVLKREEKNNGKTAR